MRNRSVFFGRLFRWLIIPLLLLWKLAGVIIRLTGRKLAIALAVVTIVVGFSLTVTVIGGVIGLPMLLMGLVLLVRALTAGRPGWRWI